MSNSPPSDRPAPSAGSGVISPLAVELTRARRLRWLLVGLAVLVLIAALWAFGVRPAGVDLPAVLLGGLILIAALYGLDAAVAEWRSRRLLRLSTVQEQRRRDLAEEVARLDRVDLAARHLLHATTLPETAERLRFAARELVPARKVGVLLRAADDLLVSVEGEDLGTGAGLGAGAMDLASRALVRGAALRWSQDHGTDPRSLAPRLAVPLRDGAEVVGVLVLERGADASPFAAAEQRALERLSPHAGRALTRAVTAGDHSPAADRPAAPLEATPATPLEVVDLAALVPAVVDGVMAAEGGAARRIVVLAPTPARIRTDPTALAAALQGLLHRVHAHAPAASAIAVDVLICQQQAEVVIAHGGGVLSDDLLDEPGDDAPDAPAPRPAIAALGGSVSVRDRSGVPQVRVRLPAAGRTDGYLEEQGEIPPLVAEAPAGSEV